MPGSKPLLIAEMDQEYDNNLKLEELFKKYFEDLAKRQNQLDNAFYNYVPEIKDQVDQEVAQIIVKHKDTLRIPLLKVDRGYLLGSDI